jgi:GNAT superfamily N-acetyltransferase
MGDITIRGLEPSRAADFLAFFDHRGGPAFADNPEWASCYCQFYHTQKALDWGARGGDENRAAMSERIATGEMEGFLAYADAGDGTGETVVGWLNAQPRNKLPHCFARMRIEPTASGEPDYRSALIVCFVIHPQWRRRGVARALLAGAIEAFAARGIREIEAYPFKSGESQDATDHYHGPLNLFLASGFTVVRDDKDLTVVRKSLAPR